MTPNDILNQQIQIYTDLNTGLADSKAKVDGDITKLTDQSSGLQSQIDANNTLISGLQALITQQ